MKKQAERKIVKPVSLIAIAMIGLCAWSGALFLFITKIHDEKSKAILQTTLPTTVSPVPTIIQSKNGWNIYRYPDKKKPFRFEYPSDWQVKTSHERGDMPTVELHYKKNKQEYNISINTWRAAEYYGDNVYSKDEKRNYNQMHVIITTIYENTDSVGAVAYFEDFDTRKDPIQTISIDLIRGGDAKVLRVFEHILSSVRYE